MGVPAVTHQRDALSPLPLPLQKQGAGYRWAHANLGNAYGLLGDFSKAIEYHTQRLAIAMEVGDRAGEGE